MRDFAVGNGKRLAAMGACLLIAAVVAAATMIGRQGSTDVVLRSQPVSQGAEAQAQASPSSDAEVTSQADARSMVLAEAPDDLRHPGEWRNEEPLEFAYSSAAAQSRGSAGVPALANVERMSNADVDALLERLAERGAVEVSLGDDWPSEVRLLVVDQQPSYYQLLLAGNGILINLSTDHVENRAMIEGWAKRVAHSLAAA